MKIKDVLFEGVTYSIDGVTIKNLNSISYILIKLHNIKRWTDPKGRSVVRFPIGLEMFEDGLCQIFKVFTTEKIDGRNQYAKFNSNEHLHHRVMSEKYGSFVDDNGDISIEISFCKPFDGDDYDYIGIDPKTQNITELFDLKIDDRAFNEEIERYADNEVNSKENLLNFIFDFMKKTGATKIVFDD